MIPAAPSDYSTLYAGDPAPWFRQRCIGQKELFSFDMVAGRFNVLCFYGAASDAGARDALAAVQAPGKVPAPLSGRRHWAGPRIFTAFPV